MSSAETPTPEAGVEDPTGSAGQGGFAAAWRHLQDGILDGRYAPGTRLPAERDLAASLGVSRSAVREALRALQALGVLAPGSGPGNGTTIRSSPVGALSRVLQLHLALDSTSVEDLVEARVALERAAAASAARVGDPVALARAALLVEQSVQVVDVQGFNVLDTDFHLALAEMAGVRLISDVTVAIRRALHEPIGAAERALPDWEPVREVLVSEHRSVLAAVRAGDPVLAADRVEAHIRHAHALLGRPVR